jgi:chromosome segregation ATPase
MSASINDAKTNLQQIRVAIRQVSQDIDNLDDDKTRIERKIAVLQTMESSLLDSERKAEAELARITASVAENVTSTRTLLDRPQA